MPSNLHEYFLAACLGLSVFYILLAWTWCRKTANGGQRLTRGAAALVVLLSWAGMITVVTSATLVAVAKSFADGQSAGRLLQVEGQRLREELLASPRYASPLRLNHFEAKVYSQNGEDGIIAEIFHRIGTTNRFFAEFGAADGSENNTVLLLRQGWSGQWVEGDPDIAERARQSFSPELDNGRLVVTQAFITAENAEELLAKAEAPDELDLFSLDIDRNDYYVWEAIKRYRPRVVIMEYNPIFPPGIDWVVEYDGSKWWDGTSKYGASLTAYERLGREKGYSLVACDITGTNAFFVRSDLAGESFEQPYDVQNHYEPARGSLKYSWGGHPRNP